MTSEPKVIHCDALSLSFSLSVCQYTQQYMCGLQQQSPRLINKWH